MKFIGTTIYVSHKWNEIYRLCNQVSVMTHGKTEKMVPVADLFHTPETFHASLLSGCKNFSEIGKSPSGQIIALDWHCPLQNIDEIPSNVGLIGIHANAICVDFAENDFLCRIERIVRDIHSIILIGISPAAVKKTDFSHIRIEVPKQDANEWNVGDVISVGFSTKDVLFLQK